jgi:putative PEP-CTERM system TPR-repeat lipoprotein
MRWRSCRSACRLRARVIPWLVVTTFVAACTSDPASSKRRYQSSGDRYASAGKHREAVLEYRNALQQDPRDGEIRTKLGESLLTTGDLEGALGEYVRAADLLPDNIPLQLKAGSLLLLAGRFDDAKSRAEKVLARNDREVRAQILLANALAALKEPDAAVAQIEDAIRVDPDRSGPYATLGAIELSRGRRDEAEQAFARAVELAPRSVAARLALGNFYWLTDQRAEAESALKAALEIEPRHALTNRALANFYLASNERVRAERPLTIVYEVTKTPASAFALAQYYIDVGNDGKARDLLLKMLEDPRAATTANVALAALDDKRGQRDEAYKRLNRVLDTDAGNLQALVLKTSLLLTDGKIDDAVASATFATERYPDSTAAFFALGRAQAADRQPDKAIAAFRQVLRLNPRAAEAKVALADLHLAQGKPDTSIGFAQEALANDPGNANAQLVLVRGLLTRGELDRASIELNRLVRRFPESPAVRTENGILLARRHDYAGAKGEFEHALRIQPDGLEPLGGLIALDLTARNYRSARARIDARLAGGKSAALLVLAARTYAAGADLAAAERFLRRALELDAGYLPAYGALGQLYIMQHRLDEARREFELIAERARKSVAAHTMVGILLQMSGDVDGARERFERVLQIDPDAAVAANNLAWIYATNEGNLDVALSLAQTAHKRLPGVAKVSDTLGFIYFRKNLKSLAVSTLKVSAEQEPGNPVFQYHLGLAYAGAGDVARAKASLARALALKADFEGAPQAKTLLASLNPR